MFQGFMNNSNSTDKLLDYIDEQKEQISRYESRLRDVIRAYKSLAKEKEALERSVKVLSHRHNERQQMTPTSEEASDQEIAKGNEDEIDGILNDSEESITPRGNKASSIDIIQVYNIGVRYYCITFNSVDGDVVPKSEVTKLSEQLATLSSSLVTVSEEKAKISARFQADKKLLLREMEQKTEECNRVVEEKDKHISHVEDQLHEVRQRLKQTLQERDEEMITHTEVIKELQQILENERQIKDEQKKQIEQLENQLTVMKDSKDETITKLEQSVTTLGSDLKNAETKINELEKYKNQPTAAETKLQQDLDELRAQHMEELANEQQRLQDSKNRIRDMAHRDEYRVADLERKVSELSDLIGVSEREKERDQITIRRLKEKVLQLNVENTSLTETSTKVSQQLEYQKLSQKESNTPYQQPDESLEANQRNQASSHEEVEDPQLAYQLCKRELAQVKEDFEKFKSQTQLHAKSRSQDLNIKEYRSLQRQVVELNNKLISERSWFEGKEKEYKASINYFKAEIKDMQGKFDNDINKIKSESLAKLDEARKQMQRQRERTIELLADKEAEVDQLKTNTNTNGSLGNSALQTSYSTDYLLPIPSRISRRYSRDILADSKESMNRTVSFEGSHLFSGEVTEDAVNRLLSMPATATVSSRDGILLHYQQEQAKIEIELTSLRKSKFELEEEMRDLAKREQTHLDLCKALKEEIRKLERDKSRETANLEYLKNIVLHYMEADNPISKLQIVKAIATILQFSPKELDRVLKRT
ncbi:GRIP and coiled-coil domain-containing protein 1 [Trichoplax sp. H2]|nr:GRIP and coiled-coil domain-containing protein 1 [Trichoplax sp. H2]|eukprot:RDD42872.1 GRIP and coiled-coil domain-containing protein 1 [Trichoplax sp. H2]